MKEFDINKLQIASPCHIGWQNMSGDDRIRFCQSCKLNVFNISEMTEIQVRNLITKTEGRICGRIYRRSDGTVLTKDCPVGLKNRRKRLAKYAGTVLASIISLFSIGFGQDKKDKKNHEKTGTASLIRNQIVAETGGIKGVLTDQTGAVITNAEISLIDLSTKKKISVKTNESGEYNLSKVPSGKYKILFDAPGFPLSRITDLSIEKHEFVILNVRLEAMETVTVIVGIFLSEPLIDTTSSSPTYILRNND